jgi:NitT/TauT family transport system substrate-binding protein
MDRESAAPGYAAVVGRHRRDGASVAAFLETSFRWEDMVTNKLKALTLAAIATFALSASGHAQEKKQLLVAEPGHGVGFLPVYIAIRKGYFAEQGLDVKTMTVQDGSSHVNTVLAGQAFAFIGGPEHAAFAKLKGAELRSVVNITDRGNAYFMAATGKGPKPGEDLATYLKGKVIATANFGGTQNSITRYLLKKWNLNEKTDVTMKEMLGAAVPAAVKAGGATIGMSSEPFITRGIKQGFWEEPFISIPKELGPYAFSTINVKLESIQKDPDTVRKFVTSIVKALQFTYGDRAGTMEIAKSEFPTMAPEDLQAALGRAYNDEIWSKDGTISTQAWETAKAVVMAAGLLKQSVDYDKIIDTQFVKK